MKKAAFLLVSVSLFLAACADPAANKSKASVSNAPASPVANSANSATPAAAPSVPAGGIVYKITPENAKVEFTGSKVTGKHDGGFKSFTGSVVILGGKAETSQVTATVDMTSVFSDADGLTDHLKTPDFFDTAKYPSATFTSTKIEADAAKGAGNFTVTGELDFRGQKKTITFPAKITLKEKSVEVESEFSINRKDFGVAYAGKADDLIRDDVVIRISVK